MKITMQHVRKSKMCANGAREFAKRNNIDFQDFLKNGIDSEKLKSTNDTMALKVIEIAEDGRK